MSNLENNTTSEFIDNLCRFWTFQDKRLAWAYLEGSLAYMDEDDCNWGDVRFLIALVVKLY